MFRDRQFEFIKDIGSGNFGVAKLMRDRQTGELVAVKFIERGEKIDKCARALHVLAAPGCSLLPAASWLVAACWSWEGARSSALL